MMQVEWTGKQNMKIKIHRVVQGPHEDEDGDLNILALLEFEDGTVGEDHIYGDLDFLYSIQKWCSSNIEPYILDGEII